MSNYQFSTWILLFALCNLTLAFTANRFVDVHEIGDNKVAPLEPPVDPAIHSFPTVPTVPLVPTCMNDGYFRDPFNCGKFYYCEHEHAIPRAYYCQFGLIFDSVSNSCDHPNIVECWWTIIVSSVFQIMINFLIIIIRIKYVKNLRRFFFLLVVCFIL